MTTLKRRKFLKLMGWGTAGLTVTLGGCVGLARFPALPHRGDPTPEDAALWISLRPEGHVELVLPRVEIGQGIAIAMRQIVADGIGLPLNTIRAVMPRTDRLLPVRATVGSDSIKDFTGPATRASLALRAAILQRAADRVGEPVAALHMTGRGVKTRTGRVLPLTELAAPPLLLDADVVETMPAAALPPRDRRREIGRARPVDNLRAMVTGGAPLYADDIRLDGMLHGAVIRPDRPGAERLSVDESACRAIPGYRGLVLEDDLLAILADSRPALERARQALSVEWRGDGVADGAIERAVDVDRALAGGALEHVEADDGDLAAESGYHLDLRLDIPMAAHAAMEPRAAVARFDMATSPALEVWTGSQDPFLVRDTLAKWFGLGTAQVVVHNQHVGGGFGGKAICNVELEAARLAKLAGRPVKVQWRREEEFQVGFHRPPSSHRIRAALAKDGTIARWWHAFRSGHSIFTSAALGPTLQFATSFIGDPGVMRGATPPYAIGRTRIEFEDVRLPIHTGPWRGLGAGANVWAMETAIDALARAAGADPLDFRIRNIAAEHPRLRRVLRQVAERAGWDRRRAGKTTGYGLACGIYKAMSFVAVIARVERRPDGEFQVTGLWAAHDCGTVVNPDRVRAQVEGNLVWSIGMALGERLGIADGRPDAENFGDYTIPVFSQVPEMVIDLIDEGDPPTGAGETALVAGTAAITNAITAITGKTVTRLPVEGHS